jgi:Rrf2 family protein
MAQLDDNQATASHVIARERGISEKFLLKVLKPLVTARILHSIKGPRGGYRLARSAREISLLEILEAVDGPIRGEAPDSPVRNHVSRNLESICHQLADVLRRQLGKLKVAELNIEE